MKGEYALKMGYKTTLLVSIIKINLESPTLGTLARRVQVENHNSARLFARIR